jgi:general secretion pathway protein A
MRCLQGRMTWDQLVGWDRPALLQFSDEQGRAQPLLLQGLSGEDATVNWGEGPRQLPVAALQAHWSGDATVLWRLPVGTVLIGTGSSGASVRWLRRQLSLFEGTSEPPSAAVDAPFDEALGARVRRFQESQGLRVDGIVGPHTMLRLSNLGPAGGEPRLVARPGES